MKFAINCFSTTAEFCAVAKSENRGIFIGNETGGSYDGNTSGYQMETILPYSKIGISTGTIKYEMDVKKPQEKGRGIIPDYNISPSVEDLINKKDIQLEFALKKAAE